jgi:hypothetical protein
LLTPVVIGRKYLPLHPVDGNCDHVQMSLFVAHHAYPTFTGLLHSQAAGLGFHSKTKQNKKSLVCRACYNNLPTVANLIGINQLRSL